MREIGRGAPVSEAPPVQGRLARADDAMPGPPGVVALVDDPRLPLPDLADLVAVVCTAGDDRDPLADAAREAGVPCILGVTFDGGVPPAGTLVLVDCSKGGEGVVEVVDGGAAGG